MTNWVYEKWDSEEPERPVCRSIDVQKRILEYEAELRAAMDTDEFSALDQAMNSCKGIDLDVRLRKKAEV